jgi:hypothetical protein
VAVAGACRWTLCALEVCQAIPRAPVHVHAAGGQVSDTLVRLSRLLCMLHHHIHGGNAMPPTAYRPHAHTPAPGLASASASVAGSSVTLPLDGDGVVIEFEDAAAAPLQFPPRAAAGAPGAAHGHVQGEYVRAQALEASRGWEPPPLRMASLPCVRRGCARRREGSFCPRSASRW